MNTILSFVLLGVVIGAGTASAAGHMPAFTVERWVNSTPLTPEMLRGKVVLVDFWEYTRVNWIRTAPYVKAWHRDYADRGLVQPPQPRKVVKPKGSAGMIGRPIWRSMKEP
jgi:hypothetical protein